jgi:hypothetical protein
MDLEVGRDGRRYTRGLIHLTPLKDGMVSPSQCDRHDTDVFDYRIRHRVMLLL